MNSIDTITLRQKLSNGDAMLLIDVREPWEHQLFNIGGLLLPMRDVFNHIDKIPTDKPVVFYCQKGIRSALIIQRLQQKFCYTNLLNLSGGVDSWKQDV